MQLTPSQSPRKELTRLTTALEPIQALGRGQYLVRMASTERGLTTKAMENVHLTKKGEMPLTDSDTIRPATLALERMHF